MQRWNQVREIRLANQGLSTRPFAEPGEVVRWLGAVQSQEYELAKWSVAQRCARSTVSAVEAAIADGTILRTHVLRPTWHFVHRDDIRWLLDVTAPRVRRLTRYRHRQLGITAGLVSRSTAALAGALEGGNHLTRRELAAVLQQSGIATEGQVLAHLVMDAEFAGVICSGAPRGRQQTYALLDERAPDSTWLPRDEALAELTSRYFRSHGPATARDFQWWATLNAGDVRHGIEMAGGELQSVNIDGRTYWYGVAQDEPAVAAALTTPSASSVLPRPVSVAQAPGTPSRVHLLQPFDEYLVGYSESRDAADSAGLLPRTELLSRVVVLDGQIVGRWRRPAGADTVELELLRPLTKREQAAVEQSARPYLAASASTLV